MDHLSLVIVIVQRLCLAWENSFMQKILKQFIQHQSASAFLLLFFAVLALVMNNTAAAQLYHTIVYSHFDIYVASFECHTQLLHITNEGLMSIFFLLVGVEIKRELMEGELNTRQKAILPAVAAVGGMLVPACIYCFFNRHHPIGLRGWAIPTATDIAFALGILTLLGSRVPNSLKVFLMALAIFDDLGAIVVIALFYMMQLSGFFLFFSGLCIALLALLNFFAITRLSIYVIIGLCLWYCLMKAGIHATLAGGILAAFVPLRVTCNQPAKKLQHVLHPWVSFAILPIFAFANAGVSLVDFSVSALEWSVVCGVFFGLFLGKQIGILVFTGIAVKSQWACLPAGVRWKHVYAMSVLCGIGFTVSLFIGTLAFGDYSSHLGSVKIGVLSASVLSGLLGSILLISREH